MGWAKVVVSILEGVKIVLGPFLLYMIGKQRGKRDQLENVVRVQKKMLKAKRPFSRDDVIDSLHDGTF